LVALETTWVNKPYSLRTKAIWLPSGAVKSAVGFSDVFQIEKTLRILTAFYGLFFKEL
jgi:hypothetical protein